MWFRHDNKTNNGVSILFTRFSHHIGTDEMFFIIVQSWELIIFHNSIKKYSKLLQVRTTYMFVVRLLIGMIHYSQNLLFVPCDKQSTHLKRFKIYVLAQKQYNQKTAGYFCTLKSIVLIKSSCMDITTKAIHQNHDPGDNYAQMKLLKEKFYLI